MRRRHNRYFRPLKIRPNRLLNGVPFYVADTETGTRDSKGKVKYDLKGRPENFILGSIVGPDFEAIFYDRQEMVSFLESEMFRGRIVYFHNAEYDLSTLYGNVYKLDPNAIFNGSKFIVATNGVCKFADSLNILPTSVEKIGAMLGRPKGKPDFNDSPLGVIADYCINDCRIVYDALFNAFGMTTPQLTIGSLALQLFRQYFLEKKYYVDTINDEFFPAYYGGRTEAFKIGKVDADVYDINSAYPFVMRNMKFPDPEHIKIAENVSPGDFAKLMKRFEGMATVTVRIKDLPIPPLPVRQDNKLIFPVGEFTGSWVFPELRAAMPYIESLTVHRVLYSKPIESPFRKFIDHYYSARSKTDNEFLKYFFKLLMNNLYGKLAQRNQSRSVMLRPGQTAKQVMKFWGSKSAEIIETEYGEFLVMQVEGKPKSFTIASWASYITASVRVMLFDALTPKSLYCDTDSVFVPKGSRFKGKLSSDLGGWKKEQKRVVKINTLKDYDYIDYSKKIDHYDVTHTGDLFVIKKTTTGKTGRALKGVKKNSLQISQFEFEYLRMIKTKESFRRIDGKPAGTFIKQRKAISGKYTKREILKNGKTKAFKL